MFEAIDTFLDTMLQSLGIWGPIVGCFLINIESMVPILPLFVFITLNFLAFGNILGFVISWFFTCVGCSISFFLFFVLLHLYIIYLENKLSMLYHLLQAMIKNA